MRLGTIVLFFLILMEMVVAASLVSQTNGALLLMTNSEDETGARDATALPDADKIVTVANAKELITSINSLTSGNSKSEDGINDAAGNKIVWTILIYIDADNDLEKYAIRDIKEMLRGAKYLPDCVCVLIQIDRHPSSNYDKGYTNESLPGETQEYTGARRYQVANNGTLIFKQDLGEVNMGSGNTLNDFVRWGRQQCPSEKVALIIWDHGIGDAGVAIDESNGKDKLKLPEIRQVLENYKKDTGKKMDVIGFDACLMAAAEVITEFNDLASILIGSEDVEPGDGWNYESLFREFGRNACNKTALDLGNIAVSTYGKHYDVIGKNRTTLVAIDMSYVPRFQQAMGALTRRLVEAMKNDTTKFIIARAIEWARNHSYEMDGEEQIDLYHFLQLLQRAIDDVELRKLIQEVLDVILYMRTARHGGRAALNATGISIYFKKNSSITYTYRGAAPIKFNATTSWQELIKLFIACFRNPAYREWLRSNPVSPASITEVIGSIYPRSSGGNPPPTTPTFDPLLLTPFPENGFPFTVELDMPPGLDFPNGGWIHIYERIPGERETWDPIESFWIDSLSSNSIYTFDFNWRPSSHGWVSLDMEFEPFVPGAWPQLPGSYHDSMSFSFIQENDPTFFIPPPSDPLLYPLWSLNASSPLVGDDVLVSLDLINAGLDPFAGGTLDILAFHPSDGFSTVIGQVDLPPLDPGDVFSSDFIFTPDLPGMWEFGLDLDGNPLPAPSGAPKEWSSDAALLAFDPLLFDDYMTAQVLLDDGLGLYDPIDLPFHDVNWIDQPLYLEFDLPIPPPYLPAFNFTLNAGYPPSYVTYSTYGVVHPENWTMNPDGSYTALVGPFSPIPSNALYPGSPYRLELLTNITGERNVLLPDLWEIMQQPDPTLPDVVLRNLGISGIDENGVFDLFLTIENVGSAFANGTQGGIWVSARLPNGTFVDGIYSSYGGMPDINPGEIVQWHAQINYSQFLLDGFHEIGVWLSYWSATYDRIFMTTMLYYHHDPLDPILDVDPLIQDDIILPEDSDPLTLSFGATDDGDVLPFVDSPTIPDPLLDVDIMEPLIPPLSSASKDGGTIITYNTTVTTNFTLTLDPAILPVGTHEIYLFVIDEAYNTVIISFVLVITPSTVTTTTTVPTTTTTTTSTTTVPTTTTTTSSTPSSSTTDTGSAPAANESTTLTTEESSSSAAETSIPLSTVTTTTPLLSLILALLFIPILRWHRNPRKNRK